MIIRNNQYGNSEVSAGAVSVEQEIEIAAGGATVTTSVINVQGLPRIAVQCESRDNNPAQTVEITIQGAIAQEGATPRFFNLNPQLALLMTANNYVYGNYNIALQYVRVSLTTVGGLAADVRVRMCASQ